MRFDWIDKVLAHTFVALIFVSDAFEPVNFRYVDG
jgi:hypothetical protein